MLLSKQGASAIWLQPQHHFGCLVQVDGKGWNFHDDKLMWVVSHFCPRTAGMTDK